MDNRAPQVWKNSKGLTLIEALIAALILSIGLLGMASLLYSVMGYNQYAETITTATILAQDKVEDLKKTAYSSVAAGTVTESGLDAEGNSGGIYARTTTVDAVTLSGLKIVTVAVNWRWNGQTRTVTLKTILKG